MIDCGIILDEISMYTLVYAGKSRGRYLGVCMVYTYIYNNISHTDLISKRVCVLRGYISVEYWK